MSRPNIVVILTDDQGYGDVSCLNPERGKIPTPNMDRIAKQGMVFTDGHSGSSVCTPARYGLLTGRYCWRRLTRGIVGLYGPAIIYSERTTLPRFLQEHGYRTACIGKWHLGWSWPRKGEEVIFDQPIKDGPTARGFDYYFGTDVPNWPPYCFIRNDRIVGTLSDHLPVSAESNMHSYPGPAAPGWRLESILPTITDEACNYIDQRGKDKEPFFLYFPMTSPHTPLAVNEQWKGKSGLNLYADFVMETDAMVGRVLDALDRNGLAENTLLVFASDNGCAPYIGVKELEEKGHYPSASLRGYKSDIWDGGHRVPFMVRWPGVVKPGRKCEQLVCLTDLMRTCTDILKVRLPDDAAEDSFSMLPLLRGNDTPVREAVVHHSIDGKFAIREKRWKLVLCAGSGGWTLPDAKAEESGLPAVQLYDMENDPSETTNVQDKHPDIVKRMIGVLEKYAADGRSTPGVAQKNDRPVDIWRRDE